MKDRPVSSNTPELADTWQLLMGAVLDQRMRWPEVAAELGITQGGLRALLAIEPGRPQSQRDLAKAINCDPSYITGLVDDLERAGYAIRRTEPEDRRIKSVVLTDKGIDALHTARDGLFSPPEQFTRLSVREQRDLARLLRRGLVAPTSSD